MERKTGTPDPTPEEIWGTETTMGLAEQERMKRPDSHWPEWKQTKDGGK